MRRRALVVAVLAMVSLVVAALPAQAATPLKYVALGDSYSAGSGILPLDLSVTPLCARSTRNYPHLVASATGARLTDVTCGAAQTSSFTQAQYPLLTRPQFDALTADTDLVTLTIGGNDANVFIGAILACGAAGVLSLGAGNPCEKTYGATFDRRVDEIVYPAVKRSLKELRAKVPRARVAIVGYPWILPSAKGCFQKMPVAAGDIPYLRALQERLNRVIEKAAKETRVTFVDMAEASEGHDACAPLGTRWVEPVLWGTNFVPVHPNAAGEAAMAKRVMAVLGLAGRTATSA